MPNNVKPIETIEEYQDAKDRIAELDAAMPGSPDEEEQMVLLQAIRKWEHDHGSMPNTIKPLFMVR